MIIVMPWGHATPYGEAQGNNTALFEKYLLDDLIPAIDKTYRTLADREHRALVGLSMGGGQALAIGLPHLDTFSALALTALPCRPISKPASKRFWMIQRAPTPS